MGIRSTFSTFGRWLRAAINDDEGANDSRYYTSFPVRPIYDPLDRNCQVCAGQKSDSVNIHRFCHAQRATYLTSRPLPDLPQIIVSQAVPIVYSEPSVVSFPPTSSLIELPIPPRRTAPAPSPPSYSSEHKWCSRKRTQQYKSLANNKSYTPYRPYDQSSRPSRSSPGSCRRKPSPAPPPPKDDIIHHTLPFARLVVAIQSALLHIRYAISGHMALRLYDPLWDTGLPVGTSSAMRPSIVCPSATRDVLPSWAAVSQNAFHFNPRKPNHLQVLVDGRFVTIAIQWVDDSQFGLPGSFYEVDQIHTVYDLSNDDDHRIYPYKRLNQLDLAPPVLGLKSLLQNIAQAYIQTNIDGNENEQRSLGYQVDACLKILVRQMGPPGQFVLPTEVPAIYESAFTNLYYMSFGTLGMQIMHAISGGMPSQAATDVLFPVPNIRPGSTGSTTSTVSTASTSSMSSAASSSSTHTIHRKPLPPNSRHKVSPMK